MYGSQTNLLEDRTTRPERLFEALFKGVSSRFGLTLKSVSKSRSGRVGLFGLPKDAFGLNFGEHRGFVRPSNIFVWEP
jgi:hypothetical protein